MIETAFKYASVFNSDISKWVLLVEKTVIRIRATSAGPIDIGPNARSLIYDRGASPATSWISNVQKQDDNTDGFSLSTLSADGRIKIQGPGPSSVSVASDLGYSWSISAWVYLTSYTYGNSGEKDLILMSDWKSKPRYIGIYDGYLSGLDMALTIKKATTQRITLNKWTRVEWKCLKGNLETFVDDIKTDTEQSSVSWDAGDSSLDLFGAPRYGRGGQVGDDVITKYQLQGYFDDIWIKNLGDSARVTTMHQSM